MVFGRRASSRLSVVVPVYDVEDYLPACLDSILAQRLDQRLDPGRVELEVVVVDDGSPDSAGQIADAYAASDARVRVVHTANHGLGAARNEGVRHATGDLLAFADSDDVVPAGSYAAMVRELRRSGSDLVTGSVARWEVGHEDEGGDGRLVELRWMRRLHHRRLRIDVEQEPEILGDVFAWNKLFRREFYDGVGLSWPEGVRYEDQPTTTRAFVEARRFSVIDDVVYHWRVRHDGSSITQQSGTVRDLTDRWATKRMSLATVAGYGSAKVTRVFGDLVLPGDLHRYFLCIPGCDDDWWRLLVSGVRELWGARSLTHSGLPPVHRLTGWLVERDRREDAELVMRHVHSLAPGERVRRVETEHGWRLDVPGLDPAGIDRQALELRPLEV